MGRPATRRAGVDDVEGWDRRDVTEAPVVAATNEHDHSMFLRLADNSRMRVDRTFVETLFQTAQEAGATAWRSPMELARACLSIGAAQVMAAGYADKRLEAMVELERALQRIDEEAKVEIMLESLRESGMIEEADRIERLLKGA